MGLLLGSLLLCGAPLSRVASACESSHAHVQIARAETALNRVETSETRELSVCYLCAICVLSVCYLRIALSSDSQSYLDSYLNSYLSRECGPVQKLDAIRMREDGKAAPGSTGEVGHKWRAGVEGYG